jgi:hypothetical protein
MSLTTNVFDSPGLPLLLDLEERGFDVAVRCGELLVNPVGRLTPAQRATVSRYRRQLIVLVIICDPGVQDRLAFFKLQTRKAPHRTLPDPALRDGMLHINGFCYSCGQRLPQAADGRWWRCSLARRMAAGQAIAVDDPAALQIAQDADTRLARSA